MEKAACCLRFIIELFRRKDNRSFTTGRKINWVCVMPTVFTKDTNHKYRISAIGLDVSGVESFSHGYFSILFRLNFAVCSRHISFFASQNATYAHTCVRCTHCRCSSHKTLFRHIFMWISANIHREKCLMGISGATVCVSPNTNAQIVASDKKNNATVKIIYFA